nr:ubiquitin-like-specific protease 1 [Quercus suber]
MCSPYDDSMDVDGPSYYEDRSPLSTSRGTKRPFQEEPEEAAATIRLAPTYTHRALERIRRELHQKAPRRQPVPAALYLPREPLRPKRYPDLPRAGLAQRYDNSRAPLLKVGSRSARLTQPLNVDHSRDSDAARTALFGRSPSSIYAARAQASAPPPPPPSPRHHHPGETDEAPREIASGWFVTTSRAILDLAAGLVTSFLAWFNHRPSNTIVEEIVSVEAAPRSNKRRAIGREVALAPGSFPFSSPAVISPTPDNSRPTMVEESAASTLQTIDPRPTPMASADSTRVAIPAVAVDGLASPDQTRDDASEEPEMVAVDLVRSPSEEPSLLVIGSARGRTLAASRLFKKHGPRDATTANEAAMPMTSPKSASDSLRGTVRAKDTDERRNLLLPSARHMSKTDSTDDPEPVVSWAEPKPKRLHKKQLVKNHREQALTSPQSDRDIGSLVARATNLNIASPLIHHVRRNPRFVSVLEAEVQRGEANLREAAEKAAEEEAHKLAQAERDAVAHKLAKEEAEREAEAHKLAEEAERNAVAHKLAVEEVEREAEAHKLAKEAEREALAASQEALINQRIVLPLSQEWSTKVDETMATTNPNKILATAPSGADLRIKDFDCLLGKNAQGAKENWLNDEVVNGFLDAAIARELERTGHKKSEPAPVATYHSGWYNTVTSNPDKMRAIARWSRRKHIQGEKLLQTRKVLMPINTGAHWLIIIISPLDRTIEVLDSLHGHPGKYFRIAREWLAMELGTKYVAAEWIESATRSSRQGNYNDCGAFTCFNALAAVKGVDYTVVNQADMQDGRRMIAAVLLNRGMTGDFDL